MATGMVSPFQLCTAEQREGPGRCGSALDVNGERFAIRQAGDGGTTYDWLSRPNRGYGFAAIGTPNRPVEEHRESIRVFLAMIDPNTGVTDKVDALYGQPAVLPADAIGPKMARLRREHHRMLGNGYCTRPAELDCAF